MTTRTIEHHVAATLRLVREGKFGTPDNRQRGSTSKDVFWKCYDGADPKGWRNTMVYAAAKAGAIYRSERANSGHR